MSWGEVKFVYAFERSWVPIFIESLLTWFWMSFESFPYICALMNSKASSETDWASWIASSF